MPQYNFFIVRLPLCTRITTRWWWMCTGRVDRARLRQRNFRIGHWSQKHDKKQLVTRVFSISENCMQVGGCLFVQAPSRSFLIAWTFHKNLEIPKQAWTRQKKSGTAWTRFWSFQGFWGSSRWSVNGASVRRGREPWGIVLPADQSGWVVRRQHRSWRLDLSANQDEPANR